MVGISDIPCVGKAVDRISDATVDAVFRGVRYMLCYKRIVDDLNSEIQKVKVQEKEVSRKAVADRADGKTIKDHVIEWQKETEKTKMRADELSKQRPSWNPLSRLRLGRKAAHEAKNVAQLTLSGAELLKNEIAFLPANPNIPICDSTYQTFGSREEAYGKLWEALEKEDGNPIIGIYGMPGVGKTRMMEQAWEDAKTKKIFDKVTRANVGAETIDVIKLQNQLAGYLGCHFESADNEVSRASQLKNSLSNGGKTLVVLDDVWDHIPLQKIGIPLTQGIPKGCKILLTSRKEDVCLKNHCEDPIKINELTDGEAWDMFNNTVGTSKIDSLHDTSLAENVCKECAGLPLLIHAVGNALKFDNKDSWKNALSRLQNHHFDEIEGMESGVSAGIQLSFDKLGKDTKSCLFLCSVFPEDSEIEIKMLEDFATGSQLLNPGINVPGVVDKLKSASLLLDGESHRTVKLHDIIRDVARCLAARDEQHAFCFIRGGSCFPIDVNYRTRRLLQFVESDNFRILNGMVCPDLHTLWLEGNKKRQQFPKSFFEGIGNLKILVLKYMRIFPEHMSVQTFNNLNVLILDGCHLNEIWLSNVPENLETLRISECRRIPNPLDLSKLKSLRKLQVLYKYEIKIVQYSISTLFGTLEELHIPGGFKITDAKGKRISTPISSELNKLTALKSLNIRLEDSESCPNENIVGNLRDFIVHMGEAGGVDLTPRNLDTRLVVFNNTSIEGGGKVLVERAEKVLMFNVEGSPFGLSNSNNREAFWTLKKLYITSCDDIEHLASIPQNEIQQSQPLTSFSKLTELFIYKCRGLKYLFSASVAECLVQLEELKIFDCERLEVVVKNESAVDRVIINFPKLKELMLEGLPSLRSFYGENRADNTSIPDSSLFDTTVVFSALETLYIAYLNISEIWEKNCPSNDSFYQLKSLTIRRCNYLKFAIPHTMLPTLQKLEQLMISGCEAMTSEVESSSNECSNGESTIVALRSIVFDDMPVLTHIRLNSSRRNLYPNLQKLTIGSCNSLRNVFLPSIAGHLKYLEELYINNCEIMSEIIGEEEREECRNCAFDFPELIELQLDSLPNFKSFCCSQSAEASRRHSYSNVKVSFPKLVTLDVNLKTIKWDEIELGRDESTTNITKLVVHCDNKVQLPSAWQLQFRNIEELSLKNCWWSGNIMEPFSNLKMLSIHSFHDLEHLAFISRYEIQQSQQLSLFPKLTSLVIVSCLGLKYLFSASVANCLVQLQQLRVENCPTLEVVIRNENNGVIPKFPKLKELTLWNLQTLRRFYGKNRDRSSSSTTITETAAESESLFDGTVMFPALEILAIKSLNTSEIWGENCYKNNYFCLLKLLYIESCPNLKFAIRLPMLETLQQLEELKICKCDSTLEVVMRNESETDEMIIKLPKLKRLILEELPSLRRFYRGTKATSSGSSTIMDNVATTSSGSDSLFDEMVEYPTLETLTIRSLKISEIWGKNCSKENSFCRLQFLEIERCDNLEFAIPQTMLPTFQNLEELDIRECESMTSEVESSSSTSNECLPQLVSLSTIDLHKMPGLTQTGLNSRGRNLYPNLDFLDVSDCENLKSAHLDSKAKVVEYLTDVQRRRLRRRRGR